MGFYILRIKKDFINNFATNKKILRQRGLKRRLKKQSFFSYNSILPIIQNLCQLCIIIIIEDRIVGDRIPDSHPRQ